MRQATGVLVRLGRMQAHLHTLAQPASSSSLLSASRSCPGGLRVAEGVAGSRKQWIACSSITLLRPQTCLQPQFVHAAKFASVATPQVSSKDGPLGTSPEEPITEEKSDPVCKPLSEKEEGKGTEKKAGGNEKKAGVEAGKPEAEKKAASETAEQKLQKEIKKLEQLIREKDSLLEDKEDQIKELKDNVLRSYAELENFRERSKREAESTRKFSIQSFGKALLDVSDNLERALSCVPEDFASKNPEEVHKLLKTLLEGVQMTEKQLMQVLKKFGVERFDPSGQPFDPNVHLAICEVADPSKPPGTVAHVFKAGYLLHERVLRPAEVSVVKGAEEAA